MYVNLYVNNPTMKTTATCILDTRFSNKSDGRHPVKLRVTHRRQQNYYALSEYFTADEFEKMKGTGRKNDHQKYVKIKLDSLEKKANDIIQSMSEFSFPEFEKKMFPTFNKNDAFEYMKNYEKKLISEDRIKYSISFKTAINSFGNIMRRTKLPFSEVTVNFLSQYEKKMLEKGESTTTIGMYQRNLRTIYNLAIEEGVISRDSYPFGKGKYVIPTGKNIKKALGANELSKIFKAELPEYSSLCKARDFWFFIYLCNGINVKDLAKLKFDDVKGNTIVFLRSKTANTSRSNPKMISVPILPEMNEIIKKWGNDPSDKNNYIFPILEGEESEIRKTEKIANFVQFINKNMKKLALQLGIEGTVTTYTARHSWATLLKRSGTPLTFISDGLGHHNLSTTESYLASFEDEELINQALKLTNFLN